MAVMIREKNSKSQNNRGVLQIKLIEIELQEDILRIV